MHAGGSDDQQIDAETLRAWLDGQQPVTVLDVRSDEDRAQWAIPGSIHVPHEPATASTRDCGIAPHMRASQSRSMDGPLPYGWPT
jgi:rhodanese-related sulfurtransferase